MKSRRYFRMGFFTDALSLCKGREEHVRGENRNMTHDYEVVIYWMGYNRPKTSTDCCIMA